MTTFSKSEFPRNHNRHASFKRYCEYEGFQSLNHSKEEKQYKQQVQTQIIMFPPSREVRSKTSWGNRISFQNIGETIESKPKLGQRNAYSRQNIQLMNKKIKQMKQTMYGSNIIDPKSPQKESMNSMTLTGSSKLFQRYASTDKFSRSISSSGNLRSNKFFETSQNTEQQVETKTNRIYNSKSSKTIKNRTHKASEIPKSTVEAHKFRTTLKKKHIDDNPKVLVNIIRKKVETMDEFQIHNYIQSLMRRAR